MPSDARARARARRCRADPDAVLAAGPAAATPTGRHGLCKHGDRIDPAAAGGHGETRRPQEDAVHPATAGGHRQTRRPGPNAVGRSAFLRFSYRPFRPFSDLFGPFRTFPALFGAFRLGGPTRESLDRPTDRRTPLDMRAHASFGFRVDPDAVLGQAFASDVRATGGPRQPGAAAASSPSRTPASP